MKRIALLFGGLGGTGSATRRTSPQPETRRGPQLRRIVGPSASLNEEIITNCYNLLGLSLLAGIEDYTEGIYQGCQGTPYAEAQRNQHDYLLDQLGVTVGFRLLDVGCGTGSLLRRAAQRGATATGITLSPRQVDIGRARGLDVRLMNYMLLGRRFAGEFDGIVANGSIEHFCQPEQAASGFQDAIYEHMFDVFHRALRSSSPVRRLVTTVIHFRGVQVPPEKVLRSPLRLLTDRRAFHFSIIHRGYGGYYPSAGQLPHCAQGRFRLLVEQDATQDYHFTSEDWLNAFRHALRHNAAFRRGLAACWLRRPRHTSWFALSLVGAQSWPWQFRGGAVAGHSLPPHVAGPLSIGGSIPSTTRPFNCPSGVGPLRTVSSLH